jgi:hypothetical protein
MSAFPYIYEIRFKIPARWRSKRVILQIIAINTDFEVQEIRSRHSYDYDIQIWFGETPGMINPLHAFNACIPLMIPYVCPKGSHIRIAVENYKNKLFGNRVRLMFCGNRLYAEPGDE